MRLSRSLDMIDISGQMENLNKYFHGTDSIVAAYLYGSYGTKYQTPLSDVDFALLTRERTNPETELKIFTDITDILEEEDVSIVFLKNTDIVMQYKVLSTGRLIYCSNRLILADFIENVIKMYCDFQVDLKTFYADYDQGLKEEYLNG